MKVTAPDAGLNGRVVGLTFTDGAAEAEALSRPQMLWLRTNGYTVDGAEPVAFEAPDESWTKQRIEDYATARGVDLSGVSTKADMLAAINNA